MASRCHPDFEPLLDGYFSRAALDATASTVVGLWPDATLAYLNAAWDDFAAQNGGQPEIARRWDLGASYLDAIAEPLLPFYRELLARIPPPGSGLRPVTHEYECSSGTVFRKFGLQAYGLANRAGFLFVHSLLVEHPHDAGNPSPDPADAAAYEDAGGMIRQCAHCRRVRSLARPDRWDWVPRWVETNHSNTSHTICPICFEYYYPLREGGPPQASPADPPDR